MSRKANGGKSDTKVDAKQSFFCTVRESFRLAAQRASIILGSAWAFIGAVTIIVVWALTGHIFHYSDTWQLIINTGTTIITFLMVFLIQNSQNRDARAIQLKLDELIRAQRGARNALLNLDDLTDEELEQITASFARIAAKAKHVTLAREEAAAARSAARKQKTA